MTVLMLSDLHLPNRPSPLRDAFINFLRGPARNAEQVYILGDLFEYWLGDDVSLPEYSDECQALRELSDIGVKVFYMHGNRDFMVGQRFAESTGAQILPDPYKFEIAGRRALLSHGDRWCVDDRAYQRMRKILDNQLMQRLFLSLPGSTRRKIALRLRNAGRSHNQYQPKPIADVNQSVVHAAFERHGVNLIVHGHTHRPHEHDEGAGRQRFVLPDWRPDDYRYLRFDGMNHRLDAVGQS